MKILLLSRSRVVRELFRLALKAEDARLDIAENLSELEGDRYDLVFVEGGEDAGRLREHLILGRLVRIRSEREPELPGYDRELLKPFVPSDVLHLLSEDPLELSEEELSLDNFLAEREERSEAPETQVLDGGEIAKIKELLEDAEGSPKRAEKPGKKKQKKKTKGEERRFELDGEELLELLGRMKSKRMRRLLAGAEVTVTIRFPKERE